MPNGNQHWRLNHIGLWEHLWMIIGNWCLWNHHPESRNAQRNIFFSVSKNICLNILFSYNWHLVRCANAYLWIHSPVLQRTIRKCCENNYKDSPMMTRVVCATRSGRTYWNHTCKFWCAWFLNRLYPISTDVRLKCQNTPPSVTAALMTALFTCPISSFLRHLLQITSKSRFLDAS